MAGNDPKRAKEEAGFIAQCARRGIAVIPSPDEHGRRTYIASQGAWLRELPSLDALRAFAARVDGRQLEAAAA